MPRETAFYAQGFRREGRRIIPDRLDRYRTAEIAIAAAERLSHTRAGAIAISVTGDSDTHDYDEPVEIYRAGDVPGGEAGQAV